MYSPQYPAPPPGYSPYEYLRTPPMSPNGAYYGYSPRYSVHTATPSPRASPQTHARRKSQDPSSYAYGSPRGPAYYTQYSSPRYFASQQSTPQRNADYVSSHHDRDRSDSRRFWAPPDGMRSKQYHSWGHGKHRSQSAYTWVVEDEYSSEEDYLYDEPLPPYEQYQRYSGADHYYYGQVPIYEPEATPRRSHARRSSHTPRAAPTPQRPRPSTAKSPPKATEEDARNAGIPAGYSYKNWDPTEEPILLLGSVFDANSLGKWIYDWTVFHYGAATPMSEVAGELWLLLIQLAGKTKRAEEVMPKIRNQECKDMVEEFLESGERLWIRFAKLLKICEDYMMKAARRESGEKKPVQMGKNSGCEFVDSIFGRDRKLEETEKLMTGMRLWSMRFDANCDDILRNPAA